MEISLPIDLNNSKKVITNTNTDACTGCEFDETCLLEHGIYICLRDQYKKIPVDKTGILTD